MASWPGMMVIEGLEEWPAVLADIFDMDTV